MPGRPRPPEQASGRPRPSPGTAAKVCVAVSPGCHVLALQQSWTARACPLIKVNETLHLEGGKANLFF